MRKLRCLKFKTRFNWEYSWTKSLKMWTCGPWSSFRPAWKTQSVSANYTSTIFSRRWMSSPLRPSTTRSTIKSGRRCLLNSPSWSRSSMSATCTNSASKCVTTCKKYVTRRFYRWKSNFWGMKTKICGFHMLRSSMCDWVNAVCTWRKNKRKTLNVYNSSRSRHRRLFWCKSWMMCTLRAKLQPPSICLPRWKITITR